jgi:hypothetical protein
MQNIYDNLFTQPDRPFLLLQSLKGDLCIDWFKNEEELQEHAIYYKEIYGEEYKVKDALEIHSCRTIVTR